MKRAITSIVFVISFVILPALGIIPRVQAGECSNASIKGTYSVNADCTGSFVSSGLGAVFHNDFVIDDNKKEIRLIPTEPGFVAVCNYRKQ